MAPTEPRRATIDTSWFRHLIADRELSQRQIAKLMHLEPSAVSLMLRGQRGMRIAEAAELAKILKVPLSEVLEHAGVRVGERGLREVPVLGRVVAERVEWEPKPTADHVIAPEDVPLDGFALMVEPAPKEPRSGWLLFLSVPSVGRISDCVDRFSVALVKGEEKPIAGIVRRGLKRGTHTLESVVHGPLAREVQLEWCEPVLWIRP